VNEETATYLLSDAGRDLLTRVAQEAQSDPVRALIRLRKSEDADRVTAAWEIYEARKKSAAKFGELGASMYFTTEALEQASSPGASAYHARRIVDSGKRSVVDLCGGIGADTLAFARAGLSVILCELDPVRALFAAENARVAGFGDRVEVRCVDATTALDSLKTAMPDAAIWFDPARRVDNRRIADPNDYLPPITLLARLHGAGFKSVGAKLSPAVDHGVERPYGGELEFISDMGECKEALLWTGAMMRGEGTRAAVIGKSGTSTITATPAEEHARPERPITQLDTWPPETQSSYLYEPDPAVIRAHLVQALADRIGAHLIDPHIAYLIGPALVDTPFATAYAIVDRFAFHVKALNRALRERSVGRVVIKKRGFPQEPVQVRKQLKLSGDNEMTLVLTRVGQQHQVVLCHPVSRP